MAVALVVPVRHTGNLIAARRPADRRVARVTGTDDPPAGWERRRHQVVRDALSVGLATGAYALSYGALATSAGLSVAQTCALSLLMFTGGSQFALIGVVDGGGSAVSGAATAVLLGARNAFYGLRLTQLLEVRGARKLVATQLVIDESSAMAVGQDDDPRAARLAFWTTGVAVFVFWNVVTLAGALGAEALSDPAVLGLDAAAPAAFLALIAPRVREREPFLIALASAGVALAVTPLVAPGIPVLAAAAVAVVAGLAFGGSGAPAAGGDGGAGGDGDGKRAG